MPPALSESRKTGASPAWNRGHHRLALADRRTAVEELVGDAGLGQVRLEQPAHGDVLGEDQGGAVLGQHGAEQLVDQVELLRAAGQPDRRRTP